MGHDISLQLMVVMLENLVQHSIPRVYSIRKKLEQGQLILSSELNFMLDTLNTVSHCYQEFRQDMQCMLIFSGAAELLGEVIGMALKNEQESVRYSA